VSLIDRGPSVQPPQAGDQGVEVGRGGPAVGAMARRIEGEISGIPGCHRVALVTRELVQE
jgi:hypothetical protein